MNRPGLNRLPPCLDNTTTSRAPFVIIHGAHGFAIEFRAFLAISAFFHPHFSMGIAYQFAYIVVDCVFWAWFRHITVLGRQNIPPSRRRPLLLACTHNNMVVDPFVLAWSMPHRREVHFWAKNTIFHPPLAAKILRHLGAVPVDRTTGNNAGLWKSTLECFDQGGVIAVFPEGTSYTLPHLLPLRDGASWAALEHYKEYVLGHMKGPEVQIIPVGITYLQKEQWRSDVIVAYGPPIDFTLPGKRFTDISIQLDKLKCDIHGNEERMEDLESQRRAIVKQVTADIDQALRKLTVNAPDWPTMEAAKVARCMLVPDDLIILDVYVKLLQSLISVLTLDSEMIGDKHILSDESDREEIRNLRLELDRYAGLLREIKVTDGDIVAHSRHALTPVNISFRLLLQSLQFVVEIPLFLPGILFHLPVYGLARLVEGMEKYEECKAQNKIILSVFVLPLLYMLLCYSIYRYVFAGTVAGLVAAALLTITFAVYHVTLVDDRYRRWESVRATYRMWDAVVFAEKGDKEKLERRRKVWEAVELRQTCVIKLERVLEKGRVAGREAEQYLSGYRDRVDQATMLDGHAHAVSGLAGTVHSL